MKLILICCFLNILSGCNSAPSNGDKTQKQVKIADTISKEIPKKKNGRFYFQYQQINELCEKLNLPNLDNGFDSMQVRIWFPYFSVSQIIILRCIGGKWSGDKIEYSVKLDHEGYDSISYKNQTSLESKIGLDQMMRKVLRLGITSLPHCKDVPAYPDLGLDGSIYTIEISTSKKYRIYSYYDPEENKKFKEASSFLEIIAELRNDLNIR